MRKLFVLRYMNIPVKSVERYLPLIRHVLRVAFASAHSPRICSGGYSDWNWPTSGNQAAWFAAVTYANEQGTKHLLNAPKFCMAFTAFITNIDQYICLKENNQSFNAIWKVCVWFLWDWCLFKVKYLNELIRWDIHLEITPDIRHKISHDSAMSFSKWAASDS